MLNPLWYRFLMLFGALVLMSGAIITGLRAARGTGALFQGFVWLYLIVATIFSFMFGVGAFLAP